jgi:hypothetical protein
MLVGSPKEHASIATKWGFTPMHRSGNQIASQRSSVAMKPSCSCALLCYSY